MDKYIKNKKFFIYRHKIKKGVNTLNVLIYLEVQYEKEIIRERYILSIFIHMYLSCSFGWYYIYK